MGTVISSQLLPEKSQPVLIVELDESIVSYGGRYRGKYAALKLRYAGDEWCHDWLVVQVYLMDQVPISTAWFLQSDEMEVESHAGVDFMHT